MWVDGLIAALLFAVATAVGSSHVRSINPLELGRKTWDQSQFGAAVALACGRGYGEMGADVPPTVSSFLAGRSDRVSCSELPRDLPSRPLLPAQRLYRYLLWMVAGTWWLRGVSWSGLWPLFGILYGATVAAGYGIFRLGMGRALATLASLAVTTSALNLTSLLTLRDYAKAPFLLVLIVIVAHIVKRLDRPRSLLTLATLFGLTAGIGFGFRNDVLVLAPVLVFTVLLWHPPRDWRTWQVRLAAIGVAALTFTASSAPILSAYARGSNSGHVALVGLMSPLNDRFGISASIYDWGYVFRDEFATTLINSYTDRVHGHPVAYFTPEYDRAITGYVLQIVRHWPADMLARADASVFRIANLPFAVGSYTSPVPEGVSSPVLVQLFSLENRLRSVLAGTGVAVVGVALCLVSVTSPSRAVLLLLGLFYLAGYPAMFFDLRHFFHLEFLGWLALGFITQRSIDGLVRFSAAVDVKPPPGRAARHVATFAAIACGLIVLPLAGARFYQERHMRSFLAAYIDANRDRVFTEPIELEDRTLLRASRLWGRRGLDHSVESSIDTEYLVAVFSSGACQSVSVPITLRYTAIEEPGDFSRALTLRLRQDDSPTELVFPVFRTDSGSQFSGVEVPRGLESCVQEIDRIRDIQQLPIALTIVADPHWQERSLYQKLADWEDPDPVASPRVYTLPNRLPVVRATLDRIEPPGVLWRTRLVRQDAEGSWELVGTSAQPLPYMEFVAQMRGRTDRFVIEGDVSRGGLKVGLVHDERWTDDGLLSVTSPGHFIAVMAPSRVGLVGALVDSVDDSSWVASHLPSAIANLFGHLRTFTSARIVRAGWARTVPETT